MSDTLQPIHSYAKEITLLAHSNYTEHTFRGALATLLKSLLPQYTPINEPQRTACGAPDYALIDHNQQPHAYIEAKDIFDKDLRGLKEHKPQFDRYKQALPRVCFTDYLEFHFYNNGEATEVVTLLREKAKGGFEIADAERFISVLKDWADCPIQPITTARRLAELMASKARLMNEAILRTMQTNPASSMHDQYRAFRDNLIRDLSPEDFADHFAQTIVYGMFAAKIHDNTPSDFTRIKAAQLVPVSNPLLRELFQYLAGYNIDDSIAWIVDDLADAFNATQMDKVLGKYADNDLHSDPLVYFYEDFLSAYNPRLKEIRGVYYTPQPVVSFIVRAIDEALRTHFALPDGLADRSTITHNGQTLHRVQILDPATGTGTFLAETVRLIRSKFQGNDGLWKAYVDAHLRPRLHGFELLMAPYTIAHLKLDLLMGGDNRAQDRLRVYLTNSLMDATANGTNLFISSIAKEVSESNAVKQTMPIMVMMGNPPYSVSSSNKDAEKAEMLFTQITSLVHDYKQNLAERNIQPLSDDYIKFIRLCHHFIDKNGSGIFGVITNNSYLDGLIHRRMRELLLDSFDHIYIVNLHGNSRKKETAPDGTKDENVFDIMAGVSIAIFVKSAQNPAHHVETGHAPSLQQGKVHYLDLYGLRKDKYDALNNLTLATAKWQELSPSAPNYFFVPKDFSLQEEYEKGIKIDELFNVYSAGIQTGRDALFYDMNEDKLLDRINILLSSDRLSDEFIDKYNVKDSSSYNMLKKVALAKFNKDKSVKTTYRPFDSRYIYYDKELIKRPFYNVSQHLLNRNNLALILLRQSRNGSMNVFAVDTIASQDTVSSLDPCTVFPLYLYDDTTGAPQLNINTSLLKHALRHVFPDFSPSSFHSLAVVLPLSCRCLAVVLPLSDVFSPDCSEKDAEKFAALTFLCYIYALLHSPSYRQKYREFLKIDFPRIPLPADPAEYLRLVRLGDELINLHLMRTTVETGHAPSLPTFPIEGTNTVEQIKYTDNRVYINSTQYFADIPESAFNFFVGGYQPAQKWLKDRKGRTLNFDDIDHYRKIISILKRTEQIMQEIG